MNIYKYKIKNMIIAYLYYVSNVLHESNLDDDTKFIRMEDVLRELSSNVVYPEYDENDMDSGRYEFFQGFYEEGSDELLDPSWYLDLYTKDLDDWIPFMDSYQLNDDMEIISPGMVSKICGVDLTIHGDRDKKEDVMLQMLVYDFDYMKSTLPNILLSCIDYSADIYNFKFTVGFSSNILDQLILTQLMDKNMIVSFESAVWVKPPYERKTIVDIIGINSKRYEITIERGDQTDERCESS